MKLIFSLLIIIPSVCFSQTTKSITGTVADKDGNQLAKATVSTSQSKKTVLTNELGNFQIENVIIGEIITVSMIGYKSTSVVVDTASALEIALEESLQTLDDVVVIGYGEVNRKDLTGSVGTANMEDMRKAPVSSFDQALAGRVAGVQVTSVDGQPGVDYNIVIRGGNSITQSNAPLFVIDGFPMESAENNVLNPDDIASIEVLKDASSTAIYGARGANGVILITTKKAKPVVLL
ncbi:TonB-dependent receptor plug domain-containing protein [Niabella ginsengisoli]|uniref:TonB-dependent receptor plug domain-containing protein n=1 Tax=Niabella ginsengisoli TaxID=522298 RepID=A0ABS9SJ78_9BACT|nr:TonB-dependent receptor plug domain-containing protein [Niabella ginsengisoli]MCH5598410.1 TonB-dependent receptor plug domain-containing protein [Niabella ginsengisoli]